MARSLWDGPYKCEVIHLYLVATELKLHAVTESMKETGISLIEIYRLSIGPLVRQLDTLWRVCWSRQFTGEFFTAMSLFLQNLPVNPTNSTTYLIHGLIRKNHDCCIVSLPYLYSFTACLNVGWNRVWARPCWCSPVVFSKTKTVAQFFCLLMVLKPCFSVLSSFVRHTLRWWSLISSYTKFTVIACFINRNLFLGHHSCKSADGTLSLFFLLFPPAKDFLIHIVRVILLACLLANEPKAERGIMNRLNVFNLFYEQL